MKKIAGIWIDHRAAVIVLTGEGGEIMDLIEPNAEKHTCFFSPARSEEGRADGHLDRQFAGPLDDYYDAVIARVRHTESVMIFGEAKSEIEKRLDHQGLAGHISRIQTADNMTDPQIVTKVRQYFQ